MDPRKTYVLSVNINGHGKQFVFGQTHEVCEEWVQVIEQARSAFVAKSSLRDFERNGSARAQEEFHDEGAMKYEYVPDYAVIREREA